MTWGARLPALREVLPLGVGFLIPVALAGPFGALAADMTTAHRGGHGLARGEAITRAESGHPPPRLPA